MMLTNLNEKARELVGKEDEMWEEKVVRMVERYLVREGEGQGQGQNLAYCSEYVARLVKGLPM